MSERVSGIHWLWIVAIVALGWGAICVLVNDNQEKAINDLQRRIAVLEQERR